MRNNNEDNHIKIVTELEHLARTSDQVQQSELKEWHRKRRAGFDWDEWKGSIAMSLARLFG